MLSKTSGIVGGPESNPLRLSQWFAAGELVRDAEFTTLDEVATQEAGALVFCQSLQYQQLANGNPNVAAVITTAALSAEATAKGVAEALDPRLRFFHIYNELAAAGRLARPMEFGRGEGCRIHPSATISPRSRIGDRVEIGANAVIEDNVAVGNDCYIGQAAILGAEGLLTIRQADGNPLFVRHAGGVEVGSGVVILAGAIVAKSLYRTYTTIGEYTQVGIMANVGHGARLGPRCVISGNCVVAGRCELGEGVWMGVTSAIAQGIKVGKGAQIKMGSMVIKNVDANQVVSGNFAMPHARTMMNYARMAQ